MHQANIMNFNLWVICCCSFDIIPKFCVVLLKFPQGEIPVKDLILIVRFPLNGKVTVSIISLSLRRTLYNAIHKTQCVLLNRQENVGTTKVSASSTHLGLMPDVTVFDIFPSFIHHFIHSFFAVRTATAKVIIYYAEICLAERQLWITELQCCMVGYICPSRCTDIVLFAGQRCITDVTWLLLNAKESVAFVFENFDVCHDHLASAKVFSQPRKECQVQPRLIPWQKYRSTIQLNSIH